jgi:hypothetical protein
MSEEKAMRTRSEWRAMVIAAVVTAGMGSVALAQVPGPRTYTATATVKTAGGASTTAPVTITISRWTTDAERTAALAALKQGDTALKGALDAMPVAGSIQVGARSTPLHFARTLSTGAGTLITVVATQPLAFVGAGAPEPKPKAGYHYALATFEIDGEGKGSVGDLAPAAKLKSGPGDAIVVDDYGAEAVRLTAISSK